MAFGMRSGGLGNPSPRLRAIFSKLKDKVAQRLYSSLRPKLGLKGPASPKFQRQTASSRLRSPRRSAMAPNLEQVGQFQNPPPAYQGVLPLPGRPVQPRQALEDLPRPSPPEDEEPSAAS